LGNDYDSGKLKTENLYSASAKRPKGAYCTGVYVKGGRREMLPEVDEERR